MGDMGGRACAPPNDDLVLRGVWEKYVVVFLGVVSGNAPFFFCNESMKLLTRATVSGSTSIDEDTSVEESESKPSLCGDRAAARKLVCCVFCASLMILRARSWAMEGEATLFTLPPIVSPAKEVE